MLEVALCSGNKTEEERGIQHQKRRAVRSAWATFISEQFAGKKVYFRELSDKNRNISHEECQRLQARGSLVAPARGDKRKHRAFVKPLLQARQQAQTKLRTERWRHCQHDRSQTRVLDSMLVTARATGGKMVSLPKEAKREARFNMAVERARAKERKRAIQQFRQTAAGDVRASISHHCASIDTLADDVLRTPDLGCDAWEFAPDVSTQCEKVMTFATEQNHVSNFGLASEIDWQRRMGIICAERAAAFTTKAQGRNPSGRVEDVRRLLMRRGRRETKVVLQCVAEADQISVLGGFQKKSDT